MDAHRQTHSVDALPFVFRPRDLEAHGIPRSRLATWLRRGTVEQMERGLYLRVDAEPDENETVSTVVARVPQAVVKSLPIPPTFFKEDTQKERWRSYLTKNELSGAPPDFAAVGEAVRGFLEPLYDALVTKSEFQGSWQPGGPWQ